MTAITEPSNKLLPCPFCGARARFEIDDERWEWVECSGCGIQGNRSASLMEDCKPKLAEAWNRRTQVVPQGWKLVPEEASSDMVNAGEDAFCGTYDYAMIPDVYAAMLAAAPQPPEDLKRENPATKPEAAAEHKALRSVYEAARGLLRYEGVDDGRAITYREKLASAVEEVKHIDSGLWEPPEEAPVQMPEPVAVAFRFETEEYGTTAISFYPSDRLGMGWSALYTEHQVRQLLASKPTEKGG